MVSKSWEEEMQHEQTRLYFEKLTEIIKEYIKPDVQYKALEIGLDVGISAKAFLQFENIKLTDVDCGDVEYGKKFISSIAKPNRWAFIPKKSDDFFIQYPDEFDIIFVDGDHSYAQSKKDLLNAWEHLLPGGLLIAHDVLHKANFMANKNYGTTRAMCEFLAEKKVDGIIHPPYPGILTVLKK